MTASNKATLIAAAVFVVVVVAALLLGIATERRQPTKLAGLRSWDSESLPLSVIPDPELSDRLGDLRGSIAFAIAWWNDALGFHAFVPLGDMVERGDMVVVANIYALTSFRHDSAHMAAFTRLGHDRDRRVVSAGVYIDEQVFDSLAGEQKQRVLTHELGHVLGLAHDSYPSSIMYGQAVRDDYHLSIADREYVRRTYGRQ